MMMMIKKGYRDDSGGMIETVMIIMMMMIRSRRSCSNNIMLYLMLEPLQFILIRKQQILRIHLILRMNLIGMQSTVCSWLES